MEELIEKNYQRWLSSSRVSDADKEVLRNMTNEEKADAFYKDAEFGTAGMRGVLGPGTNRLNLHTVRRVAIGFAKYVLEVFPNAKEEGIVIAHDNRHFSREFTLLSAEIFNDYGIKAYIFDSLRPTPELSYAVRELKACGGVMVTASHNPKEYNGYKVYDETGCQLVPSKIKRLIEILDEQPDELKVDVEKCSTRGETVIIPTSLDEKYVKLCEEVSINKDLDKSNFKIVFTPNHGTAYVNGMKVFKDLGYEIYPLLKQCTPDPDFSETLSPNPEDERSFIEPIKYAKEIGAKLIVMTDPDGDRCGLGCLTKSGEYKTYTGNQSAVMLLDYMFTVLKERGELPTNSVVFNTIVSSEMGKKVCDRYNVKLESFLTGFKFIGDRVHYYETHEGPKFFFGYEESYGCLAKDFARDKDGIQAILLYSEMANYYDKKGMTLEDVWNMIGEKYGYTLDIVENMAFKGPEGALAMQNLMKTMHENPYITINGVKVVKVQDYLKQQCMEGDKVTPIDLPKSDVVKLSFEDGTYISVRPSGTEPKVKFYIGVNGDSYDELLDKEKLLFKELRKVLNI